MTRTSFTLEVRERWDENLVQEERAAVHLDGPGQEAPEVIDIPERRREKQGERSSG